MGPLGLYRGGHLGLQSGQPRIPKNFEAISCLCFVKNRLAVFFYRFVLDMPNIFCLYFDCLSIIHIEKIGFKKNKYELISIADTLIPSSFIYFSHMGDTGPCDSSQIIFGNHVYN